MGLLNFYFVRFRRFFYAKRLNFNLKCDFLDNFVDFLVDTFVVLVWNFEDNSLFKRLSFMIAILLEDLTLLLNLNLMNFSNFFPLIRLFQNVFCSFVHTRMIVFLQTSSCFLCLCFFSSFVNLCLIFCSIFYWKMVDYFLLFCSCYSCLTADIDSAIRQES